MKENNYTIIVNYDFMFDIVNFKKEILQHLFAMMKFVKMLRNLGS